MATRSSNKENNMIGFIVKVALSAAAPLAFLFWGVSQLGL